MRVAQDDCSVCSTDCTAITLDREAIHDLRNLFGIVASARHMLDDDPNAERRAMLLAAIESAALRGGDLTTKLLTRAPSTDANRIDDINQHVISLQPMIQALAGRQANIVFDLATIPIPVRLKHGDLDAALLELVANARKAMGNSGRIMIGTRRAGACLWLSVADDGRGMDEVSLVRLTHSNERPAAHGSGFARVRRFAESAQGRLRIRSGENKGTIVCLILPVAQHIAVV
ncbi:hypothetical protein AWL63_23050 (plasmid) [Sphingomonas panacis]|uniref:Histidine kinase domain-containing protein n=2 Tax=Sphingomonas panacis TaxID=1560345 RepID=A0A1B3ZI15_9SPHN|nr:hypothetical protein AWL63_23050 [Sphingomonas panacis]